MSSSLGRADDGRSKISTRSLRKTASTVRIIRVFPPLYHGNIGNQRNVYTACQRQQQQQQIPFMGDNVGDEAALNQALSEKQIEKCQNEGRQQQLPRNSLNKLVRPFTVKKMTGSKAKSRLLTPELFECKFQPGKPFFISDRYQCASSLTVASMTAGSISLILNNDTHSHHGGQWLNFFIQANATAEKRVVVTVTNIMRPVKYIESMKLLSRGAGSSGRWARDIQFQLVEDNSAQNKGQRQWMIQLSLQIEKISSGAYISIGYPYPVSRLAQVQQKLLGNESKLETLEIGKTLLGNPIILFRSPASRREARHIIIVARQHSSQVASSFVCESLLQLLSTSQIYETLRAEYTVHILPILNPDGVIHGNSRANFSGQDINRSWCLFSTSQTQQADCVTAYLDQLSLNSRDILLDLHGHSREFGCFAYFAQKNQFTELFHQKMEQLCQFYVPTKSRYGVEEQKNKTLRAQTNKFLNMNFVVTLEASFYGYIDRITQKLVPFEPSHFHHIAVSILQILDQFARKQEVIYSPALIEKCKIASVEFLKDQSLKRAELSNQKLKVEKSNNTRRPASGINVGSGLNYTFNMLHSSLGSSKQIGKDQNISIDQIRRQPKPNRHCQSARNITPGVAQHKLRSTFRSLFHSAQLRYFQPDEQRAQAKAGQIKSSRPNVAMCNFYFPSRALESNKKFGERLKIAQAQKSSKNKKQGHLPYEKKLQVQQIYNRTNIQDKILKLCDFAQKIKELTL